MNIGMIIHSETGNTEFVANKLMKNLQEKGHSVDFKKLITVEGEKHSFKEIVEMPDLSPYDALVFGSHVEAFSLAQTMVSYLKKIEDISGKKIAMLTTQFFPKKWMGGNRAHKQMKALLVEKGGDVLGGEDVNWKKKDTGRAERISTAIKNIISML